MQSKRAILKSVLTPEDIRQNATIDSAIEALSSPGFISKEADLINQLQQETGENIYDLAHSRLYHSIIPLLANEIGYPYSVPERLGEYGTPKGFDRVPENDISARKNLDKNYMIKKPYFFSPEQVLEMLESSEILNEKYISLIVSAAESDEQRSKAANDRI